MGICVTAPTRDVPCNLDVISEANEGSDCVYSPHMKG